MPTTSLPPVFADHPAAASLLEAAMAARLRRAGNRPAQEPKAARIIVPAISTVGTKLREIIQAEIGRKLTCSDCFGYLSKLNTQVNHDHEVIVKYLSAEFPWPSSWRERHSNRREAISALIAPIVPKPPPTAPRPREVGTLQFIIPYFHQEARSDELRWCIRSIHANYLGQAHVTLIGDKPDWFVGHHINKPRLKPQSFRRYRDSLSKIDMIRYSPDIDASVMWCMDDCYFLKPFNRDDFAQGRLNNRKPGLGSDDWNVMLRLTAEAQIKAGLQQLDFSCHLPQMINRERWHEMFERFGLAKQPLVWESMYGAMFAADPQPHKGFMLRWQGPKQVDKHQDSLSRAWMLNHTHEAWNGSLRSWLAEKFPEPSRDEKP
jgi:hypothetical protein